MRILVLYAHPRPASFNRAVLEAFVEAAAARGHAPVVRDLYAIGFDPCVTEADLAAARGQGEPAEDVRREQAHVREADVIVAISPVWWIGWPAILKGYVDRVFSYGFAYAYGPGGVAGLLGPRRAIVIGTTGSSEAHWRDSGKSEAVRVAQDVGTFELSGIAMIEHLTLSPVGRLTPPEAFAAHLERVRELVRRRL